MTSQPILLVLICLLITKCQSSSPIINNQLGFFAVDNKSDKQSRQKQIKSVYEWIQDKQLKQGYKSTLNQHTDYQKYKSINDQFQMKNYKRQLYNRYLGDIDESIDRNHRYPDLTFHVYEATNDHALVSVMNSIQTACIMVAQILQQAPINGLTGQTEHSNSSGDQCKQLDILANQIFIDLLESSQEVFMIVSEENEDYLELQTKKGQYYVAFDPLDGSSNIDTNVSIGSIWTIFKKKSGGQTIEQQDILQKDIVSAGYCIYGPSIQLVYALNGQVNGFTFDHDQQQFVLTNPSIKMPDKGNIYSVNEGYYDQFGIDVQQFIHQLKQSHYSLRYTGSMVADIHRTLFHGGVFIYPIPKLRLMYEGLPMAYIIKAAGGLAISDDRNLLDIVPQSIHQKVPIVLGSQHELQQYNELS